MNYFSSSSKDNGDVDHHANSKQQEPFFKHLLQPKLTINQPNDAYEQEADAMADKVMRMPDPAISNNLFFKPAISSIQRKCAHCEEEEKNAQRKETNKEEIEASAQTNDYINTLSGGRALNENERHFFESRIGYDFSDVKIHTDSEAAKSAQAINALAYTSGNNIVFNSNQYKPETESGKRLISHELTHVVQQNTGGIKRKIQRYNMDNAPYGDPVHDPHVRDQLPADTSGTLAVNGVCGPDITAELTAAIARFTSAYNALTPTQQSEVCDSLTDRQLGPVTWDIVELHNNAWIYKDYRPACATAGGQPPCGSTVQVGTDCYYAGSVNYVIFGVMCKLCNMWKKTMQALVYLYKRGSGNYQASMAWAEAGYDGWPSGGTQPAGDRNNCAPSCPTPFTAPTFNTRICPHIDPFSQCPTVTR